jgi:hypothetical protein
MRARATIGGRIANKFAKFFLDAFCDTHFILSIVAE